MLFQARVPPPSFYIKKGGGRKRKDDLMPVYYLPLNFPWEQETKQQRSDKKGAKGDMMELEETLAVGRNGFKSISRICGDLKWCPGTVQQQHIRCRLCVSPKGRGKSGLLDHRARQINSPAFMCVFVCLCDLPTSSTSADREGQVKCVG